MATSILGQSTVKGGGKIGVEIVPSLPETGQSNKIYFVPAENASENNLYEEYIWVNGKWESIGSAKVSITVDDTLSNSSTNPVQNKVITAVIQNKVDKVEGSSLISNELLTFVQQLSGDTLVKVEEDQHGNPAVLLPEDTKLTVYRPDGTFQTLIYYAEYENGVVKQNEVGSANTHINLNTDDVITVDTVEGQKTIEYVTPVIDHGTSDTTLSIPPNEYHQWGEVASLNISLTSTPDWTEWFSYNLSENADSRFEGTVEKNKITITKLTKDGDLVLVAYAGTSIPPFISYKLKISGLGDNQYFSIGYYLKDNAEQQYIECQNGTYVIPNSYGLISDSTKYQNITLKGMVANQECNIIIERVEISRLNEYMFEFSSGNIPTVLTLPDDIQWGSDNLIESNKKYQVSIVNNIAIMAGTM